MSETVLHVNMLGGFSVLYGDKPLALVRRSVSKSVQMLQILWNAMGEGVPRGQMLEMLYRWDEELDRGNSLVVMASRLRKKLVEIGLPDDNYIEVSGGVYRWGGSLSVEVDVCRFREAAQAALTQKDSREGLDDLMAACGLYRGEFLPMLSSEEWVVRESLRCQQLYFSCLRAACTLLEEQYELETMLELCTAAAEIYPCEEEWQLRRIKCLMSLGRTKEAVEVHRAASEAIYETLGVRPSQEMVECIRSMGRQMETPTVMVLPDILENLREDGKTGGAYCCSYPGFVDSYRICRRIIERTGQSVYLMLCTLTDPRGEPVASEERLSAASEALGEAIRSTLRRGDVYCRYNASGYLIMLQSINRENCALVEERLDQRFQGDSRSRGIRVQFHVASVAEMDSERPDLHFGGGGKIWGI